LDGIDGIDEDPSLLDTQIINGEPTTAVQGSSSSFAQQCSTVISNKDTRKRIPINNTSYVL
jgi:hypothetical protein